MMAALAPLFTGLGLFFCGVRFIATNLVQVAGGSARPLFKRALSSTPLAALSGVLAGLVTQSTNAVTLIAVSFARAGIIDGKRAGLVPVWSHVGASALVILVAIDTHLAVAYAILLAGVALYFDFNLTDRWRHAIMVLLGAGLLFLGLETLKAGSGPVRAMMMNYNLLGPGQSPAAPFLISAALAVVTQSSTVAGAIAVALVRVGVFDLDAALLLLAGANFGSGLNYAFLGRNGEATGRHILFFQAAQKAFGSAALVTALVVAQDPLNAAVALIPADAAGRIAWSFLVVQLFGSFSATLLRRPLAWLFERIAPPRHGDDLAKPAFLATEALEVPELALDLALREEHRLIQRLPMMLDHVRDGGDPTTPPAKTLLDAGLAVGDAIRSYVANVLEEQPDHATIVRAMRLQQGVGNAIALHQTLAEFEAATRTALEAPEGRQTVSHMVESLHLLLNVLVETAETSDVEERSLSLALFGRRDALMEGIRKRLLTAQAGTPVRVQEALFNTTILFERIIWLARDSVQALMRDVDPHGMEPIDAARQAAPSDA
ncbi:MAG: hypothetical protein ABIO39_07915 [Caulobacteraceae bacterium]